MLRVGVIDGFDATWSQARQTYGEGTPTTGEKFDQSSTLNNLKSTMDGAAPGSRWSGGASEAYGAANTEHQRVIGAIGDLDKQLGTQVTNAANLVNSGRNDLDSVKKWVHDAAATTQNNQAGERMKMTIVSRGLGQLTEVINNTDGQMQKVKGEIDKIKGEYEALGTGQKFAKEGKGEGEQKDEEKSDEEKKEDEEEKSPAEQGKADSEALQNGTLTDEQRERIETNTQISNDQKAALNNGTATMPPEQMAYLQNFSREFGDKTPAEIKAIMDKNGATGNRVADAMQLASNPNIKTGLPETVPPSLENPSGGGKHALPDGVQQVLDGPALSQPHSPDIFDDNGNMVQRGEPIGPLQPSQGLNELADIIQRGDDSLQKGTSLDSGMMAKSQEILAQANQLPIEQAPGPGFGPTDDGPRWYHENVDPTLQNMLNSVNKDDMVIHDAVTGANGNAFLDDLTKHQWQDDGLAAGGLFDWIGEDPGTERAGQTAHALAEFTSTDGDLLNLEGTFGYGADGQSLGEVNPELTRDMARAFSPYFDNMVGVHPPEGDGGFPALDTPGGDPTHTRQLMSVLYSDHPPIGGEVDPNAPQTASEIMTNSTQGHIDEMISTAAGTVIDGTPGEDSFAMKGAATLQAAMDLGAYDERFAATQNAAAAQEESYQLRSTLWDLSSAMVDEVPKVGGPTSSIAELSKQFFLGPEPVAPGVEPPGTRDMFPVQMKMAEVFALAGAGDPQYLAELQKYMPGNEFELPKEATDSEYREFYNHVTSYLPRVGDPAITGGMTDEYWRTYSRLIANAEQPQ